MTAHTFRANIHRYIAGALTAGVIVGGTAVVAAEEGEAATVSCAGAANSIQERSACELTWRRASELGGSMAPLSNFQVVQYNRDWCTIKRLRGTATANASIKDRLGYIKGTAVSFSSDYILC